MPSASVLAALSTSARACVLPGVADVPMTTTRASPGMVSLSISSRFPPKSDRRFERPVMLAARPRKTGDKSGANRIGVLRHYDRDRGSCFLRKTGRCSALGDDNVHL